MFFNGIIVQGSVMLSYIDQKLVKEQNYRGIYSGTTWPLEAMDDIESVNITNKLSKHWLQSAYNLYTCTDLELVKQYLNLCCNLNISTRCIIVESFYDLPHCEHNVNTLKTEFLGYEFVASDMQISCSYEDMCEDLFMTMHETLNSNWIFNTIYDIQCYVNFRESLLRKGYELEQYYFPRIVRLSEVYL